MPEAKRVQMLESSNARSNRPRLDCDALIREIHSTKTSHLETLHPRGRVLFAEGEPARGVYFLRSGSVSVSTSSKDGRVLILRIARAGDLLGLSSVLRASLHDTTVKTLEPSCTDFISRTTLNDLLDQSKSINQALLLILSRELADLGEHTKSLLLSQTTTSKLAKLLLEWYLESEVVDAGLVRIDKEFSHEQIAQMIGSSRETVTRLLVAFRKQQIIRITAARILIVQPEVLESLAFGSKQEPDIRLKQDHFAD